MAQEAPLFEAQESQWPEDAKLPGDEPVPPTPAAVPQRDRRLLWGAIGLASMAITVGLVAFARKQGWVD